MTEPQGDSERVTTFTVVMQVPGMVHGAAEFLRKLLVNEWWEPGNGVTVRIERDRPEADSNDPD